MMHPCFYTNRPRRGRMCAALICAICALALVPQAKVHAEPVDRWVSPTGNNQGDCSNEASPCQSINFALMVSNKIGDTIHLRPGTYTEPATTEIGKSVSIVGAGRTQPALTTIVSGGLTRRVFSIKNNTSVTIADLIIKDGRVSAGSGAGIYNLGTLLLENVEVTNNAV
ncbi:MAG TPA: hypothetical protein VHO48_09990, partial [Anaerolineaceae bacterium]|nr:hypothetical protein [Anaerolineaceae bacterium]